MMIADGQVIGSSVDGINSTQAGTKAEATKEESSSKEKDKGAKWRRPKGTGQLPAVRGGHAATSTCDGKAMVLFGGADRTPTPYNVSATCRLSANGGRASLS